MFAAKVGGDFDLRKFLAPFHSVVLHYPIGFLTLAAILEGSAKKGDVLATARIAGIMAAKRTSDLIPLCHPLMIGAVSVNFELGEDAVQIEVTVDTVDRTGVEMEALHACAVACLTIYDMLKAADKGMTIGPVRLVSKFGGKSGDWRRPA